MARHAAESVQKFDVVPEAGAQAQLIGAASQYYRNRIAVEELKLDVAKFNADARNEAGMDRRCRGRPQCFPAPMR